VVLDGEEVVAGQQSLVEMGKVPEMFWVGPITWEGRVALTSLVFVSVYSLLFPADLLLSSGVGGLMTHAKTQQ
jgi:hypothetical protein